MDNLIDFILCYFITCFFFAIIITHDINYCGLHFVQGKVSAKLRNVVKIVAIATFLCPYLMYKRFRLFYSLVFTPIP